MPRHRGNPFSYGDSRRKRNSSEGVGGGDSERRKGRGVVRGGEPVKGVCVWRLIGKNADKPAPRILLA